MTTELLSIGDFARLCRLPISTLRYYHEIGVFEPAEVDPHSGYRRYSRRQLPAARVVEQLRRAGVAPNVIAQLGRDPGNARDLLTRERHRLEAEIGRARASLTALDAVDANLATRPSTAVAESSVDSRVVACHTGTIDPQRAERGIRHLLASLRRISPPSRSDVTYGAVLPLELDVCTSVTVFHTAPAADADTLELAGGPHLLAEHRGPWVEMTYPPLLDHATTKRVTTADHVIEDYSSDDGVLLTRLALPLGPRTA